MKTNCNCLVIPAKLQEMMQSWRRQMVLFGTLTMIGLRQTRPIITLMPNSAPPHRLGAGLHPQCRRPTKKLFLLTSGLWCSCREIPQGWAHRLQDGAVAHRCFASWFFPSCRRLLQTRHKADALFCPPTRCDLKINGTS